MKCSFRLVLISAATVAATLIPHSASAASTIQTMLDGRDLNFPIAPIVENQRTLVPARRLIEALGGTVGWDNPTQSVSATLGSTTIKATIGSKTALVNGKPVTLDVPARVVSGNTVIPLRFFVEHMGLNVSWDGPTNTIYIDSQHTTGVSRSGSTADRSTAAAVVASARSLVGSRYAWGGTSPSTGFDCSGFVTYLSRQVGTALPRMTEDMFKQGTVVSSANLAAGDLVFFTTYAAGPTHVGVYDGKGNFIHAENEQTGVKVTEMSRSYWAARYLGARRVFR